MNLPQVYMCSPSCDPTIFKNSLHQKKKNVLNKVNHPNPTP